MRQAVWVLIAVVALGIGYVGGRLTSQERAAVDRLQARLQELEQRIETLSAPAASSTPTSAVAAQPTGPTLKIAVVQVNELALRFEKDNPKLEEQIRQKRAEIEQELQKIQQQYQSGELSREEAQLQAVQLQQELQKQLLLAVAGPIQAAVNEVARDLGYDVVVKQEDVVLYYKDALLDDITEQVWDRMKLLK